MVETECVVVGNDVLNVGTLGSVVNSLTSACSIVPSNDSVNAPRVVARYNDIDAEDCVNVRL